MSISYLQNYGTYIGTSPSLYHNTVIIPIYLFTSIFIILLRCVEIKLLHYFERQLSLSLLGTYSKVTNSSIVKQDLLYLSQFIA